MLLVGCTPVQPPRDAPPNVRVDADCDDGEIAGDGRARQVITTLQTRDHEITVYATSEGLRFTIATAGGTVLAESLSKQELKDSFPGLRQRFDSAFAEEGGPWVDASAAPVPVQTRVEPRSR